MPYIDRDEFLKSITSRFKCVPLIGVSKTINGEECFYGEDLQQVLNQAPTEDVVPRSEVEKLQAQIENLEIIEKDLRFRNKELQKANEGLAKNINELWNELDKVIEARQEVARAILTRIKKHINFQKDLNSKTELHPVVSENARGRKDMLNYFDELIDMLEKEYIGETK